MWMTELFPKSQYYFGDSVRIVQIKDNHGFYFDEENVLIAFYCSVIVLFIWT